MLCPGTHTKAQFSPSENETNAVAALLEIWNLLCIYVSHWSRWQQSIFNHATWKSIRLIKNIQLFLLLFLYSLYVQSQLNAAHLFLDHKTTKKMV